MCSSNRKLMPGNGGADGPDELLTGVKECRLCDADPITRRYHDDSVCWIGRCDRCLVPMVVWKRHGTEPDAEEFAHMIFHLSEVASSELGEAKFRLDFTRRSMPDHWHAHARRRGV